MHSCCIFSGSHCEPLGSMSINSLLFPKVSGNVRTVPHHDKLIYPVTIIYSSTKSERADCGHLKYINNKYRYLTGSRDYWTRW